MLFINIMRHCIFMYFFVDFPCILSRVLSRTCKLNLNINHPAVKKLQEYIQIDTSRLENLELAVDFWKQEAEQLNLPFNVHRPAELPIFVATFRGRKPELPSILLNSHADVVPVEADLWTYSPFSGYIDDNCDLFGRGTQDTKSVGVQYMEAIKKLIQNNVTLDRTVHFMVVPDEETGSFRGMQAFVKTDEFKDMNIGFALDEGMTSEDNIMRASYLDKRPWQIKFNIQGVTGHGSSLQNGTAIGQLQDLINMAMEYRKKEMDKTSSGVYPDSGIQTSVNINIIEGGVANNVLPGRMTVVMDFRLSVEQNITDFSAMIKSWMSRLSNETTMTFIRRIDSSVATPVNDFNPYWVAIRSAIQDLGYKVLPVVCPASSDMIILRGIGIPAIGFTSRTNMLNKVHASNEYIPVDNFLRGIDIYVALIKRLANISEQDKSLPENNVS